MDDAQYSCAAINFACFVIFCVLIFARLSFPDGGHRLRRGLERVLGLAVVQA